MKQMMKRIVRNMLLNDGVRRLRLGVSRGFVDEEAIAEMWLGWGNPQWSATTEFMNVAANLAMRPSTHFALECGAGVSTLALAIAGAPHGLQVVSLETDRHWHEHMRRCIERLRLTNVEVRYAPLVSVGRADWYEPRALRGLPPVDLFICDGPPGATPGGRSGALDFVPDLLAPTATLMFDDVHREPELELASSFLQMAPAELAFHGRPQRRFAVVDRSVAVEPTLSTRGAELATVGSIGTLTPRSRSWQAGVPELTQLRREA